MRQIHTGAFREKVYLSYIHRSNFSSANPEELKTAFKRHVIEWGGGEGGEEGYLCSTLTLKKSAPCQKKS